MVFIKRYISYIGDILNYSLSVIYDTNITLIYNHILNVVFFIIIIIMEDTPGSETVATHISII